MLQNFNVQCVALGVSIVAMVSGCVGAQQGVAITPTRVAPQADARQSQPASLVDQSSASQDLLYVTDGSANVYVYSYPRLQLVGNLAGFIVPQGECVDSLGNVFIVAYSNQSFSSSTIYEYAHGGANPIAVLSDPGRGVGCSVDMATGNLAVSNISDDSNPYGLRGDVAIYNDGQGNPVMYYSDEFNFLFCGYDPAGNWS